MHILIKVTNALKGKSAPPSTIGSQALAQKIQEVFYRDFFAHHCITSGGHSLMQTSSRLEEKTE